MSSYLTLVIQIPDNDPDKARIQEGLRILEPYRTAMSLEDEMTVLELIEQHEDFDDDIAEDARAKAKALHSAALPLAAIGDDPQGAAPP